MKLWNQIFSKIFVLSLPESVERREHIQKEFRKIGIEKYEFFDASSPTSSEFQEVKEKYLVPLKTCFRCLKKKCNCENNFLTDYQIANWTSFIRMWKYMIDHEIQFAMLCEDDVTFTPRHQEIIFRLLTKQVFQLYRIDIQKPLLIGIGSPFHPQKHFSKISPELRRQNVMCNSCFCLNLSMAKLFYENIIIQHTSDHYMHIEIPEKFPFAQHYVMAPWPAYDLSFVPSVRKFSSLIRPKGQDRRREIIDFFFYTDFQSSISHFFLPLFSIWKLPKNVSALHMRTTPNDRNYYGYIHDYFSLPPEKQEKIHFIHKIKFTMGEDIDQKIFQKESTHFVYTKPSSSFFQHTISFHDTKLVIETLQQVYVSIGFPPLSPIQHKMIISLLERFMEEMKKFS